VMTTRSRNPLLPALGVLALVVVLGGLAIALSGDPVAAGSAHVCPEGSTESRLDVDDRQACTLSNLNSTEATFGVAVENTSRLPVTVTDVPLEPLDLVGFTPDEVTRASEESDLVLEDFEPFRLAPGEERLVQVHGQLPACEERTEGGATTFTKLAVSVRMLGLPREASVTLDPAIRLVSEPC